MHPPSSDKHQVRVLIERQLRADADFDAFCIDFFPDVYRRFTGSMERTQKVNLLLALQDDPATIIDRLSLRRAPGSVRALPKKPWWLIGCCVVLMLGLLLVARAVRKPAYPLAVEPPRTTDGVNQPAEAISHPATAVPPADARDARPTLGINAGNQIVNSPAAQLTNSVCLPKATSHSIVNSGNRIENSPGAKMSNTINVAGSR